MNLPLLLPDWPAPARVEAFMTTRAGGASTAPFDSLNLGDHVGDDSLAVSVNRRRVTALLPGEPVWLTQVHGTEVLDLDGAVRAGTEADAAVSRQPARVAVIMTADCLPVLLCDEGGSVVGAAHAGWRGLAAGVLERTVAAMEVPPDRIMAWLGPAIGPASFEVGAEVRSVFVDADPAAASAFRPSIGAGKWLADLALLARQRLARAGVGRIHGGDLCTYDDRERFFSYRRDGRCGRMGAFIWLREHGAPA